MHFRDTLMCRNPISKIILESVTPYGSKGGRIIERQGKEKSEIGVLVIFVKICAGHFFVPTQIIPFWPCDPKGNRSFQWEANGNSVNRSQQTVNWSQQTVNDPKWLSFQNTAIMPTHFIILNDFNLQNKPYSYDMTQKSCDSPKWPFWPEKSEIFENFQNYFFEFSQKHK